MSAIRLQQIPYYQSYPKPLITLSDLGLSKIIDPSNPLLETRCGSEDYASPELIMGLAYDGRQSDGWALGVLLYALLEGRLPFDPPLGSNAKSRITHRIARCDWEWIRLEDDAEAARLGFAEAKAVVDSLLKRATRRASLKSLQNNEWVRHGVEAEGFFVEA
jgi:protein-serine/threonine kinase